MFEAPSDEKLVKVVITAGCVNGDEKPQLIHGEKKKKSTKTAAKKAEAK